MGLKVTYTDNKTNKHYGTLEAELIEADKAAWKLAYRAKYIRAIWSVAENVSEHVQWLIEKEWNREQLKKDAGRKEKEKAFLLGLKTLETIRDLMGDSIHKYTAGNRSGDDEIGNYYEIFQVRHVNGQGHGVEAAARLSYFRIQREMENDGPVSTEAIDRVNQKLKAMMSTGNESYPTRRLVEEALDEVCEEWYNDQPPPGQAGNRSDAHTLDAITRFVSDVVNVGATWYEVTSADQEPVRGIRELVIAHHRGSWASKDSAIKLAAPPRKTPVKKDDKKKEEG